MPSAIEITPMNGGETGSRRRKGRTRIKPAIKAVAFKVRWRIGAPATARYTRPSPVAAIAQASAVVRDRDGWSEVAFEGVSADCSACPRA